MRDEIPPARDVQEPRQEEPEFFFYAIADGVCRLFTRHGRWNGLDGPDEVPDDPFQLELAL